MQPIDLQYCTLTAATCHRCLAFIIHAENVMVLMVFYFDTAGL
jgi:hypothetical protein